MQRIDVRSQMSADSIGVDQFHHARLAQRVFLSLIGAGKQRVAIDVPTQRRMRDSEIDENVVIEPVLAEEQFVHARQKAAGFCALDDAVIVGAANRDGFADAKLRQNRRRNRLILSRIFNRASRNDDRLTGHQARRRCDRTDRAGISERDCRPLKIGNLQLAFARACDDVVIGIQKIREAQLICVLDVRHKQ